MFIFSPSLSFNSSVGNEYEFLLKLKLKENNLEFLGKLTNLAVVYVCIMWTGRVHWLFGSQLAKMKKYIPDMVPPYREEAVCLRSPNCT